MEKIEELMSYISRNPIQILSTTRADLSPSARPFGSAMLAGGRIWYCMNDDKKTFYELRENPRICLCACNADKSWLRIHATAVFEDNRDIKSLYISRGIGSFQSADEPHFAVFYLANIHAEFHEMGEVKVWDIE